ncbi:MAG: hypothetical protein ACRC5H_06130 [Treponemataceae bacterium]
MKKILILFIAITTLFLSCDSTGTSTDDFEGAWNSTMYAFVFSASTVTISYSYPSSTVDRYSYSVSGDQITLMPQSTTSGSSMTGSFYFADDRRLELTLSRYNDGQKMILIKM